MCKIFFKSRKISLYSTCGERVFTVNNENTDSPPQIEITSVIEDGERNRRLLQRRGPFCQSNGIWNVTNLWSNNLGGGDISWEFYKLDPFHILVNGNRASISVLVLVVFVVYMIIAAMFACLYLLVSGRCGLPDMSFVGAMIFSVETMLTIGYGVPGGDDALFRDCTSMLVLISAQSFVGVLLQTVLVGIVFVRFVNVVDLKRDPPKLFFNHSI